MDQFTTNDILLSYQTLGSKGSPVIVWGHGWGQSHTAFLPLAGSLESTGRHVLVDFPGFGESPAPHTVMGTEDYADLIAAWARDQKIEKLIWVGHSFGGRVGLQLASRHPALVQSMTLIAAAGLPRKRSLLKTLYIKARILTYKTLKKLTPFGLSKDWLNKTFASADYQSAGAMRSIFVKVVNEDLSEQARQITCPVNLVYGTNDTETPPEIGERLARLIPNAKMVHLDGQDHYSVLSEGRHPVAALIKNDIKERI